MGPGIDGPVNHLHNGLLRSKLALLLARTTALFNSQFESISLMQVSCQALAQRQAVKQQDSDVGGYVVRHALSRRHQSRPC